MTIWYHVKRTQRSFIANKWPGGDLPGSIDTELWESWKPTVKKNVFSARFVH